MEKMLKVTNEATGHGFSKVIEVRRCDSIEKLNEALEIASIQDKLNHDENAERIISSSDSPGFEFCGEYIGKWSYGELGEYHGEWMDGKAHGLGCRTARDWRYAGTWLHGKQSGLGIYTALTKIEKSARVIEECEYGGQWSGGLRHGFGVEQDTHGTFAGLWHEGHRGRHGCFHADAGWSYCGTFIRELFGGLGRETFVDGAVYEGEFDMGKRSGVGVKISSRVDKFGNEAAVNTEAKYAGEWLADCRHGYGVEIWHDGTIYMGEFRNNARSGMGKVERKIRGKEEGFTRTIGRFRNGIFDPSKRCKDIKVRAAVDAAAKAATDAENARREAQSFIAIAQDKASAAHTMLARTRDIVAQFKYQYNAFETHKHDHISLETATAFPIRSNAIGRSASKNDDEDSGPKVKIVRNRHKKATGTTYDVSKEMLERIEQKKAKVGTTIVVSGSSTLWTKLIQATVLMVLILGGIYALRKIFQ